MMTVAAGWQKKSILLVALLVSLGCLKDISNSQRFAVQVALERHPPSLRIFRGLLEISFLFLALALSIHVWNSTVGPNVLGQLLFVKEATMTEIKFGNYQTIPLDDLEEDPNGEESLSPDNPKDGSNITYDTSGEEISSNSIFDITDMQVLQIYLDLLLWIFISLLLFTISSAGGGRYIDGMNGGQTESKLLATIAAPSFPLFLFVICIMKALVPWNNRKCIWMLLFRRTIGAPFFCPVTFRDGMIGDVLTSSVRPLQDIAFTIFYLVSGLQGWWTNTYDLDQAVLPVERSWIVRTIILPACMVSPLWWRFNQNLRQIWDNKKRWPYLGNAFKYFIAAQVAMFGVFNPHRQTSVLWIICAILATLYQIWWDVFMDWNLLRLEKNRFYLRSQRLFQSKTIYWTILIINIVLRFGWTMTFLPKKFLDRSGALQSTFQGVFLYIDAILATAEIFRRTLWGFLRVEWEAIHAHGDDSFIMERLRRSKDKSIDSKIEHNVLDNGSCSSLIISHRDSRVNAYFKNDLSQANQSNLLLELSLWTGLFCIGGILAVAHRGVY
jgi:EXS family